MKRILSIILLAGGMLFAIAAVANAHDYGYGSRSNFRNSSRFGTTSRFGSVYQRGPVVGYGRSAFGPYISPSYSRVSPTPYFGSRTYSPRVYGNFPVRSTGFGRSCR